MAFGKEAEQAQNFKEQSDDEIEPEPELDRFDECNKIYLVTLDKKNVRFFLFKVKLEIQERAEFLETMTQLGKRKEYATIILTEISQV
jgi:hypothetical protein